MEGDIQPDVQAARPQSPNHHPLLLSIPEEMLIEILFHFSDIDLYLCAQTCKLFNHLAVSQLLLNHGVKRPYDHSHLILQPDLGVDALSALLISIHIKRINRITFDVVAFSSYRDLRHPFSRISRLMTNLTSVQEVSMYLNYYGSGFFNDDNFKKMVQTLENLLNTIVIKSCKRLRFLGSNGLFGKSYQFLTGDKTPKALVNGFQQYITRRKDNTVETQITSDDWKYWRSNYSSRVFVTCSPEALQKTKVWHMNVGTTDILLPPLSKWTFSLLHASPITSLSAYFERLPDCRAECQLILSRLANALPRLTRIYLDKIRPEMVPEVVMWIGHFTQLETLEIYPFICDIDLIPMTLSLTLNKLRWISASPKVLSYIASHSVNFPALEFISIDCCIGFQYSKFDPSQVSRSISDLRHSICSPDAKIRVYIKLREDMTYLGNLYHNGSSGSGSGPSVAWETEFESIKTVRIKMPGKKEDLQDKRFLRLVLSYLMLFPNAEKFRLTLTLDSNDTVYVTDSGKLDDEVEKAIRFRCPNIRNIEVK